ncbi:MAG: UPF0182 family protein, partial [Alicyclobacillus sp.]|nr:UPF0182 family protein [Alicyclobacillus sp.]
FYVVDPHDPMLQSLARIYPHLFTYQVPADIRAHFRYPMDLFQAQAQALTRYHMTDPSAFYNQEDLWDIANQIYQQNQVQRRPPVYQMIRMPDQTTPHFVLSILFTPHQKDNLNGWLIADNEPGHYGQLTLYQFPQSRIIFGPMQAENQIDANPAISQQLTLWNQQGSQVVRGDLLLIPIGDTMLYVEPVYLVASRENSLPQLQRVIIDFNQQVYIDNSLGAAIQDLLNDQQAGGAVGAGGGVAGGGPGAGGSQTGGAGAGAGGALGGGAGAGGNLGGQSQAALIKQANELFTQYQQDTAKGDLAAAGRDLQQLGNVLQALRGAGGSSAAASQKGSASGNASVGPGSVTGAPGTAAGTGTAGAGGSQG